MDSMGKARCSKERESDRIAFTYAVLNSLDVWIADIQNVYLQRALIWRAQYDVWMRPAIHNDESTNNEYMLLYIYDTLVIGEYPEKLLYQGICVYFQLKEELVGPPEIYLGGSICKNVEEYLKKGYDPKWTMPAKAETTMRLTYRPELDITPVLYPLDCTYYYCLLEC
eukprot:5015000-Ditylum_brightwellii.AAC.1